MNQDRIRAMFLGVMIGDCLGKAVETWDSKRISDTYGRLTQIVAPTGHKWFNGQKAGTWTDDTQLTVAVAEGLIESKGPVPLDIAMDAQVKSHVAAMKISTDGWGRSTRDSIRRLANNCHWSKSGEKGDNGSGRGNGVPMKISPVGAYLAFKVQFDDPSLSSLNVVENNRANFINCINFTIQLSQMTHLTSISASAALAQMIGVAYCLSHGDGDKHLFVLEDFIRFICAASKRCRSVLPETIGEDDITKRFELLHDHKNYDFAKIIGAFGGGSCYSYNSVPFTMMFFVKNHDDIESMYDVVNAGGDTDSNASMLGAMLGALHGTSIFPQHLIDALDADQKQIVLATADKFYETFTGD